MTNSCIGNLVRPLPASAFMTRNKMRGSQYGEHFEEQFFPNRTLSIFGQESVLNGGTSEDKGVICRWKNISSASSNFQSNVF